MKLAFLAFLLMALIAFSAATPCQFLATDVEQSAQVSEGSSALFTLSVQNTGAAIQSFTATTTCAQGLGCGFTDLNNPESITPGQTRFFHLKTSENAVAGLYSIPITITSGPTGVECANQHVLEARILPGTGASAYAQAVTALITPSGSSTIRPGNTVEYTVFVRNNEDKFYYIRLSTIGNPFDSNTLINPTEFTLEKGESRTVKITLNVPPSTPGSVYYFVVNLLATREDALVYSTDLPVSLFVYAPNAYLQILGSPAPNSCTTVYAGNSSSHKLEVKNLGELTDFTTQLEVAEQLSDSINVSKTLLSIKKGEKTPIEIGFDSKKLLAGNYSYSLKILSGDFVVGTLKSCFDVKDVKSLSVALAGKYAVSRCELTAIPFLVQNAGSLASDYAIGFNPKPKKGISLDFSPTSFKLSPRESTQVNAIVYGCQNASLGAYSLPFSLDAKGNSSKYNLSIDLISTGLDNASKIIVGVPSGDGIIAVKADKTVFPLTLKNTDAVTREASVYLTGLPIDWVKDAPALQIAAGKQKTVELEISVPSDAQAGLYPIQVIAVSGLESISKDTQVDVQNKSEKIGFSVAKIIENKDGEKTTNVSLQVLITNEGNTVISQAAPKLISDDYTVESESVTNLKPVESRLVNLLVSPKNDAVGSKDAFIKFESPNSASTTKQVSLPSMDANKPAEFPWKIIVIIILLIGIFVLIAKDEITEQLTGGK